MSFSYSPKIVTDGLVLCYDPANTKSFVSGSTNIYDLSKNNYDGQLINDPVYSGVNYGTISLDATNDRVNIPSLGNVTNGTVSLWIRNNIDIQTGTTPTPIFELTSATTIVNNSFTLVFGNVASAPTRTELFSIYINSDSTPPNGGFGNYISTNLPITGSSIPVGWHNIVVARDSTGTRVYFDNVLLGVPSQGNNITTVTTTQVPFSISEWNNNKIGRVLNGLLSHVMIYNKGLTTAEVNRNYNALKSRFGL
jgi:hypothetical protein